MLKGLGFGFEVVFFFFVNALKFAAFHYSEG